MGKAEGGVGMAEVTWFKVLTDIFADDKIKIIQSMPEGDSLLVMWFKVLSQAGKTNDGGYIYLRKNIPYTPAMLATLFNKSQMMTELALKTFEQFEMIDIDENGYIFVTNWEKHQSIDKLNQIKEQTKLRVQNHREKKKLELMESNATVTLPKRPSNAIDIELDLDKERDKEVIKEHDENIVELTNHLIYWITRNNPKAKIPTNLNKWNDEMERIERLDKYDYMQIRSVIDWCQEDHFWKGNILSVPKLREKMGTLIMQMQRPKGAVNKATAGFSKLQQMAREEQEREASGHY